MKILLIDDHPLVTAALGSLLLDIVPLAQVLTAADAVGAERLLDSHPDADLMLLDLALPGARGTSLLEVVIARAPRLKILVISGFCDQRSVERVLLLGAAGFVPKSMAWDTLVAAIKHVLSGGVYIPTDLLCGSGRGLETIPQPLEAQAGLTQRQAEVLSLLAQGAPLKTISSELRISDGTIKSHVRAIYRAFGASNRTQALFVARRRGYEVG